MLLSSFFNQVQAGVHLVSWNHFGSCVSMCVCVSTPKGINNHW